MERPQLARAYSDKYLPGQSDYDLFKNKNAEWLAGPFFKLFYVSFILFCWAMISVLDIFTWEESWTVTNVAHGVITFIVFHWIKGCPDDTTQGEYNAFTLYEQVEVGVPWTATKKFLMLVPTLLTYMACHVANYKSLYVIVNVGIFAICLIAKMPAMHGVRILGINSTPGIDTPIQLPEKNKQKHKSR